MKILVAMPNEVTGKSFITEENVRRIEALADEVIWNKEPRNMTREELRDALEDVDVCICGWSVPRFDEFVLEKANKLKLIAYVAGSVHGVVSDAMYEKGIRIVAGNEGFARSVAEGTIAYILSAQRRLRKYEDYMRNDGWTPWPFFNEGLLEKTVGVVGYGAVSRHLLPMLKAFHVKIKLFSNHMTQQQAEELGVEKSTLEEIFSTCDIVTLHCSNSPENNDLVGERLLGMMKDGALLVNTSRGTVLDEEALGREVMSGRLRAALDVFKEEPPAMDSPLRKSENVLLIPHMAGPTIDQRAAAARFTIEDIERMMKGEPLQHEITQKRASVMSR